MIEMLVDLEFACCSCSSSIGVTLKCEGKGLNEGAHKAVKVKVACPSCSDGNEVFFEPSGMIRDVRHCQLSWGRWEPSVN
jgi:hypothetical protein